MKKFILSLGIMATIFGAVSLQSCKDDDEPTEKDVTAKVDVSKATSTIENQLKSDENTKVTKVGETVVATTTEEDGTVTTTTYSYSYELNGQTYTTAAALQAALAKLPAGSTATVVATLVQTTVTKKADGTQTTEEKKDSVTTDVNIPEQGTQTTTIQVPTTVENVTAPVDVTVTTTEKGQHSGGGIK